jgi:pimeloyl-ACP methyl ester carboxylesterase
VTLLPESLGFQTQYFDLSGLRMHAVTAGPVEGPLLILLHGFPEFWYGWRHQIGPLAQAGYRVVVPDQRGYNLSDKTPPYGLATLVGDIKNLIQVCGRDDAFVVGHDWGAFVAWGLAAQYPQRVKRLGIVNVPHPAVVVNAFASLNLRQLLRSWYIFYFQIPWLPEVMLRASHFAAMRQAVRASALPGTFDDETIKHYLAAWAQPGALSGMLGWYRVALQLNFANPADRQLAQSRITPQTLILWGERDTALEYSLAKQSLTWCDSGRLIGFPKNTHWVVEENPDEVTRLLLEHFQ